MGVSIIEPETPWGEPDNYWDESHLVTPYLVIPANLLPVTGPLDITAGGR